MGSGEDIDQSEYSPAENAEYIKRSYLRAALYPFVIMAVAFAATTLYPPIAVIRSQVQVIAYIVAGGAAGY